MPSFMDSFSMCLWFDVNVISRRNLIASVVSGTLFSLAWWIIIDQSATNKGSLDFSHYICGILATISFIMVNTVTNEMMNGTGYSDGACGPNGVKIWLFTGFVLGFAAMIAAVWLMVGEFGTENPQPGIALLLQNFMILFASLTYKFGRTEESFGGGGF